MPGIHRLKQAQIDKAKPGRRLGDGGGLFLHVRNGGAMYWSAQVTIKAAYGRGRRIELGLGRYPDVKLRDARKLALEAREAAREGIDPREARRQRLHKSPTFADICTLAYEARKAELKGDGKAGRWMSPLELHVIPKIGNRPIDTIHQTDLVDLLKPMWHDKAETARKALTRIGIVLKHAAAMDIDVDLQAIDKTRALLGKSRHVARKIPAMLWADVPEFYAELADDPWLPMTAYTDAQLAEVVKASETDRDAHEFLRAWLAGELLERDPPEQIPAAMTPFVQRLAAGRKPDARGQNKEASKRNARLEALSYALHDRYGLPRYRGDGELEGTTCVPIHRF